MKAIVERYEEVDHETEWYVSVNEAAAEMIGQDDGWRSRNGRFRFGPYDNREFVMTLIDVLVERRLPDCPVEVDERHWIAIEGQYDQLGYWRLERKLEHKMFGSHTLTWTLLGRKK